MLRQTLEFCLQVSYVPTSGDLPGEFIPVHSEGTEEGELEAGHCVHFLNNIPMKVMFYNGSVIKIYIVFLPKLKD